MSNCRSQQQKEEQQQGFKRARLLVASRLLLRVGAGRRDRGRFS